MTGVNCYTVHMTILSPMGLSIFVCFRFRYKFHLWEDLFRESLDLCHDFPGLQFVLSFCCLFLIFFFRTPPSCLSLIESVFLCGHFWGLFLFFDRVHLTSLTFHTFVLLHCSHSLHS